MNDDNVRSIVRLRHELRRLEAEGRREEGRTVLAEMQRLVTFADPKAANDIRPELARWAVRLAA